MSALLLAVLLASSGEPPTADPWIPVTRVEKPRPATERKPGYYKNRKTGTVSYYDGCNWCSMLEGGMAECTLLACPPVAVEYVETGSDSGGDGARQGRKGEPSPKKRKAKK